MTIFLRPTMVLLIVVTLLGLFAQTAPAPMAEPTNERLVKAGPSPDPAALSVESVLLLREVSRLAAEPGFASWEPPGATGGGMGTVQARYTLAFAFYGSAMAAERIPAYPSAWQPAMQNMIAKMLDGHVWGYWLREQWGGNDPLQPHNIMYHGHLQLMGAWYTRLTGDRLYETPQPMVYDHDPAIRFAWDLPTHAERLHRLQTTTRDAQGDAQYAIACETDMVWVECNTPHNAAYLITDRLYGTDCQRSTPLWWQWVRDHQMDEDGWLKNLWMPSQCRCEQGFNKTNNTWPLVFLTLWDRDWVAARYDAWKKRVLRSAAPDPETRKTSGAALFGMALAREMGDVETAAAIEQSVRQTFNLQIDGEHVTYRSDPTQPFVVVAGFLLWSINTADGYTLADAMRRPITDPTWPQLLPVDDPSILVRKAVYDPHAKTLTIAISRVAGEPTSTTLGCANLPGSAAVHCADKPVPSRYLDGITTWATQPVGQELVEYVITAQ